MTSEGALVRYVPPLTIERMLAIEQKRQARVIWPDEPSPLEEGCFVAGWDTALEVVRSVHTPCHTAARGSGLQCGAGSWHVGTPYCTACGGYWPCRTLELLGIDS